MNQTNKINMLQLYFSLQKKWESKPPFKANEVQTTILFIYKDFLYAFIGYSKYGKIIKFINTILMI